MVSDLLFVPVEKVKIILGDTDVVKVGGGSHSGRSMRHAATVFSKAAVDLIGKGKKIAALAMNVPPDTIDFTDDGRFMSRSTNKSFDFLELAKEAANLTLPDDLKGGVSIVTDNEMHDPVFPNGTAICEVEVDPDTGVVTITRYSSIDDVGRCINPLIVHGQTHGAIAQGVGQAMWEQCYTDPDSGQPLCGSLMDYGMPRADNMPSFTCEIAEVLSPTNPLGIKAGGEGGTTGAPAAVVSAIVDALSVYGIRNISMPATPYNIWKAIQDAKAQGWPRWRLADKMLCCSHDERSGAGNSGSRPDLDAGTAVRRCRSSRAHGSAGPARLSAYRRTSRGGSPPPCKEKSDLCIARRSARPSTFQDMRVVFDDEALKPSSA